MKTGNSQIDNYQGSWIIGSDEAGFGAWAGELLVAAVAVRPSELGNLLGRVQGTLRDSKALSEKQREVLFERFRNSPDLIIAIEAVAPQIIDREGAYRSLVRAHTKVIQQVISLCPPSTLIVSDGTLPLAHIGAISLPKADTLVPACSLASIFAKVTRDRLMVEASKKYLGYGFSRHKGYGTAEHQAALTKLGPCEIHRKSYRPVAKLLKVSSPKPAWDVGLEDEGEDWCS